MNQEYKSIDVHKLELPTCEHSIETLSAAFEQQAIETHKLDVVNWSDFPYRPDVEFAIAHTDDAIYVKYDVRESCIRAEFVEDDGCLPFQDSCVEFFISMDASRINYFNAELNCIGAAMLKSGTVDSASRVRYGDDVTSRVLRYTTLPRRRMESQDGDFKWSLIVGLPVELLGYPKGKSLSGHRAFANFYKCGDKLNTPHFLSWNPIHVESPSFHQPKYFGELLFK